MNKMEISPTNYLSDPTEIEIKSREKRTMKKYIISLSTFMLISAFALYALAGCTEAENGKGATEPKPTSIKIKGVEYSTELTELYLNGMELTDSDIEPLKHMTDLVLLVLGENKINYIGALSDLTKLTVLDLSDNPIKDIDPLKNLTSLVRLGLNNNQIGDISVLANLHNLTELGLGNNAISDISALSGLTNLTSLFLQDNAINDISALSGLSNLTILSLTNNPVFEIVSEEEVRKMFPKLLN